MKQYIVKRTLDVANFIIQNNATIRKASKEFCVSKSCVHKDLKYNLKRLDKFKYLLVQQILKVNFEQKHLRGGVAKKNKYKNTTKKPN